MSKIDCNRLREVLKYQPDTGLFFWKKAPKGKIVGQQAGHKAKDQYVWIKVDDVRYSAHRLAWLYVYEEFPKDCIDHINCIRYDNRIVNLRDVTPSENMHNRYKPQGKNLYLGVHKRTNSHKWQAKIEANGRQINLGEFLTAEEARDAYLAAKKIYHPTAPSH